MNINSKIYVAGHRGMVGSAILRKLKTGGYNNLVTRSSSELDLRNQQEVERFLRKEKTGICFSGGGACRRHCGKQYFSRRVSI